LSVRFCGRSPPWSAAAELPPSFDGSSGGVEKAVAAPLHFKKAAALLPHSKARTEGARRPMKFMTCIG